MPTADITIPSVNILYHNHVQKNISQISKKCHNVELYNLTKQKQSEGEEFILPEEHDFLNVNKQKLLNDFSKYNKPYHWVPIKKHLDRALKAFELIFQDMPDCKTLSFSEAIQIAKKKTASGYIYKLLGYKTKKRSIFKSFR
jgi:hypothetical protein